MNHRPPLLALAFVLLALPAGCAPRKPPPKPEDVKLPTIGQQLGAQMSFRTWTPSWRKRVLQGLKNETGTTKLEKRVAELEERLAALEACECRTAARATSAPAVANRPATPRLSRCMKDCFETFGDNVLVKADRAACEARCR